MEVSIVMGHGGSQQYIDGLFQGKSQKWMIFSGGTPMTQETSLNHGMFFGNIMGISWKYWGVFAGIHVVCYTAIRSSRVGNPVVMASVEATGLLWRMWGHDVPHHHVPHEKLFGEDDHPRSSKTNMI